MIDLDIKCDVFQSRTDVDKISAEFKLCLKMRTTRYNSLKFSHLHQLAHYPMSCFLFHSVELIHFLTKDLSLPPIWQVCLFLYAKNTTY